MPTNRPPTDGDAGRPLGIDHHAGWKRIFATYGLIPIGFLLLVAVSYPRASGTVAATGAGSYVLYRVVRTARREQWFGIDRSRGASTPAAASNPELNIGYADVFAFMGIVLGLSWMGFLPSVIEQGSGVRVQTGPAILLGLVGILSPVVAAAVLVRIRSDVESVRAFVWTRFRGRVAPKWYVFALVFFPLLYAGPVAVFLFWSEHPLSIDDQALLLVVDVFTLGIVANLIETVGWRAYLQEGLQSLHSAVGASLAVGVVWGMWHAPLFLVADAPLADLPYGWYLALLVGLSVIFGWVYNETGGSVAVVALLHCGQNAAIAPVVFALIDMNVDVTPLVVLYALSVWLVVAFLYTRTNPETLTMDRSEPP